MSKKIKVLYAGDSPAGGPANYLLAILRYLKADTRHLAPDEPLKKSHLKKSYDLVILSDYSHKNLRAEERGLCEQIKKGAGLIMIGGWGSFAGPFGGYKNSQIEKLLPINCLARDDRKNFPGGAWIIPNKKKGTGSFSAIQKEKSNLSPFSGQPPVICGLNQVQVKKTGKVLLWAQEINKKGSRPVLGKKYPLLVMSSQTKAAAFMTDAAPHWCGGFVDWGKKRVRLPVTSNIHVEVGSDYLKFFASLLRWLTAGR